MRDDDRTKIVAETLRLGLVVGTTSTADVIGWADSVIESASEPHISVIDLALGSRLGPSEMMTMLRSVPGRADHSDVMRLFFGKLARALDADESQGEAIARRLYMLRIAGELPEEIYGWEPYALDDAFELARRWHCDRDAAIADLRAYLSERIDRRQP